MAEHIFEVIVQTDRPLDDDERGYVIGVIGSGVTDLLRQLDAEPFVTIHEARASNG